MRLGGRRRARHGGGAARRGTKSSLILAVAVTTLLAVPAAVFATHQFPDVPTTHPFHNEISAVAGAGITTGFPDGEFKPSLAVTRQGMAAFFERGGTRVHSGGGGVSLAASQSGDIARANVAAGATGEGNGFVLLQADAYAYTYGSHVSKCPCIISVHILDGVMSMGTTFLQIPHVTGGDGTAIDSTALHAVVPLPSDRQRTYRLVASVLDTDATLAILSGRLTATYVPFSGDGDSSLPQTLTCPQDDGLEDNDTNNTATPYYIDSTSGGLTAIACPQDPDVYRTNRYVQSGERLRADAYFSHAEGDIDICLFRDTTQIQCANGKSNTETIDHTTTTAGHYYLQVVLTTDTGTAPGSAYTLYWHRIPPASAMAGDTEEQPPPYMSPTP